MCIRDSCPIDQFRDVLSAFSEGSIVHAGDDIPSSAYVDILGTVPAMRAPAIVETRGPLSER